MGLTKSVQNRAFRLIHALQEQDQVDHVPTQKQLADAEKHSWIRIPATTTPPPTA